MSTEEVTDLQALDRYECQSCGYVYEPTKGDDRRRVPANTPFTELPPDWRCPVCGARTLRFQNIGGKGTASGFKDNLKYGFGVNTLTPGQKNILIFGSLALAFLFFMSLYGLQ
jgi:rubredoxin